MIDPTAFIHPKAHVDGSEIGPGCRVWQFASITRGTRLGARCSVAPFALLDGPSIGDDCVISMHVAMGAGFVLEDHVFVGPNVVFANDAFPRASKDGWEYEALSRGDKPAGCVAVYVESGASIGANAVILPGVRLGRDCMVAAGAVCGRDLPAGHLFKRDGSIVPINTAWTKRRMRAA